jgi:DNA-binding winged helix-turn-helix (wHTH) protein/ATP/maltotriose-dependent transcriptional regulator MalT
MRFRFGDFELDIDTAELSGPKGSIQLQPLQFRLLRVLLDHAPAIVERETLLEQVWGRTALSANVVPQAINQLRQVLGDNAREPRYIETCHRRGYRIVCPVQTQAALKHSPERRPNARQLALASGVVLAVSVIALALWVVFGSELSQPSTDDHALAQTLSRQAEVALARHDASEAASHLRALSLLRPDDIKLRLDLAEAELNALQGNNARRTLALLATQPELRRNGRWLLLNARLLALDGDHQQAEIKATEALELARSRSQPVLILKAALQHADLVRARGDMGRAERQLEELLESSGTQLNDRQMARLMLARLAIIRETGDLERSLELAERIRAMALDEHLQLQVEIETALIHALRGEAEPTLARLNQLQPVIESLGDPELLISSHNIRAQVALEAGYIDQASDAFDAAFAIARDTSRAHQSAGLQVNAGLLMARRERYEEAEALWSSALEIFESVNDRRGMATSLGNLAAAASVRGLNQRSIELNERALTLFRELDLPGERARTAFNLALIASRQGRLQTAEELLDEAWTLYEQTGQTDRLLHVGSFRAEQRILAGDLFQAESLLLQLEDLAREASAFRQAAVQSAIGRMHLWQGDLVAARQSFEKALSLREQADQPSWLAISQVDLLRMDLLDGGDPWRVRIEAEAIAEQFAEREQIRAGARARLVAAEALLSKGAVDEARLVVHRIRDAHERFNDAALALDIGWVETWAAREEERLPRLEQLARQAMQQGFFGKLTIIQAGAAAQGIELDGPLFEPEPWPPWIREHPDRLVAILPPYVQSLR